jgi:hypothetical protein
MHYLIVDAENEYSTEHSLKRLPLRVYLQGAPTTMLACAVDGGEVEAFRDPEEDLVLWEELREALAQDDVCLVAHNYSYDARVLVHRFGLPYPQHGHCTIDLAYAAWPQQPGGYKLENLARIPAVANRLHARGVPLEKLTIDLRGGYHTPEELRAYCAQDVEICRAIHEAALERLDPREIAVEETTTRFREMPLILDQDRLQAAVRRFNAAALEGMEEALRILGSDGEDAFGWDEEVDQVRSVKPHTLKDLLLEVCSFDVQTISAKKLSPAKLAANKEAARVIAGAGQTNRMLVHRRNVAKLAGVLEIDCELCSFRSHTGRNSSPATGKGINLLNLPKHDKTVAEPIRRSYKFPPDMCAVRADAANLEYRMGALLTGCQHATSLFERDLYADPYAGFWETATGHSVTKADPERAVAKMAVLALEYLMSAGSWVGHLQREIAKPYSQIGVAELGAISDSQGWTYRTVDQWTRSCGTKIGAQPELVTSGFHTHRVFHAVHPEFHQFSSWVERAIKAIVSAPAAHREWVVDSKIWKFRWAPDRQWFDIQLDPGLEGISVSLRCGLWSRTVIWRDLGVRETPFGYAMTCAAGGNKGYRALTKNLRIENPTQSMGRNAVAAAKLALAERGYRHIGDVHDELLLIVPRTRETVLKARQDLLEVGGPGNSLGYQWAFLLDPREISVTESWYEDDMGKLLPPTGVDERGKPTYPGNDEWWHRLRDGDETLLENLW